MASDDGDRKNEVDYQHEGPAHASPYPLSRLAPAFDLIDVAREIQQADAMLGAVTGNKLRMIADQMRALQAQARGILEATQRDAELHRATCAFKKRPGAIYHLYRKANDDLYFSMLAPSDWNGHPPATFVGSYRLEIDMSWAPAEEPVPEAFNVRALLGKGEP